jgi:hypothetical protein
MFRYADKLTTIPITAPNLTNVTGMGRMFYYASAFNQDI